MKRAGCAYYLRASCYGTIGTMHAIRNVRYSVAVGTSRHFATTQYCGRFRDKADMTYL